LSTTVEARRLSSRAPGGYEGRFPDDPHRAHLLPALRRLQPGAVLPGARLPAVPAEPRAGPAPDQPDPGHLSDHGLRVRGADRRAGRHGRAPVLLRARLRHADRGLPPLLAHAELRRLLRRGHGAGRPRDRAPLAGAAPPLSPLTRVRLRRLPDPHVLAAAPPGAGGRAAPPDGVGGGAARPRLTHGERARAARAPPRRARVRALRRDPRARGGGGPAGGRGASGARARRAPRAGGGLRPDGPG